MKHEMLAKVLRHYRKQQHISVQDVVLRLEENEIHVSPKTVYSWENGTTQPNIATLLILCSIYKISNLQQVLAGESSSHNNEERTLLTEDERSLLEKYQKHPEMHDAINKLLG